MDGETVNYGDDSLNGGRRQTETSDLVADVLATTVGGAVGAVVAGPVGGLVGANLAVIVKPATRELMNRVSDEIAEARWQHACQTLEVAAQDLSITPSAVVEQARVDDSRTELLTASLMASADALGRSKVEMLGHALANGIANDGARVDHELLIVYALRQLETPHLTILGQFDAERPHGLYLHEFAEQRGESFGTMYALCATLERLNLITDLRRSAKSVRDTQLLYSVIDHLNGTTEGPPPALQSNARSDTRGVLWWPTSLGMDCVRHLRGLEPVSTHKGLEGNHVVNLRDLINEESESMLPQDPSPPRV